MRDVAALAGVSLKTVSRVVNREPGVSPELVGRVRDAVRLLGYRHNLTASSLRRADQKSATIGLLLEDISNPFSAELLRAVEDVAWRRGTLALAGSSDDDGERQRELLRALASRRVDGLISRSRPAAARAACCGSGPSAGPWSWSTGRPPRPTA
jgi:LacI family transcriptional regulator